MRELARNRSVGNQLPRIDNVLAPALEGFSPTPEFPEIEQAQALLAALAETDDLKNIAASRQRRLQLQTAYGRAVAWSRGY